MGDRNNPIKFGPEWLRNMSRERSAARSSNNNQNTSTLAAGASNPQGSSSAIAGTSSGSAANPTLATSKVLLAKLRYGREEMLALYDRNAEAPPELKVIEALYQPRGKQPVALNNSFDEEMRDCLRGAPPIGGMSSGDRFGLGRGTGRVLSDGRGRMRGSYVRMPGIGRGVSYAPKVSNPRMPFGGGADEEGGPSRAWNNTLTNSNRNSGDQADWASKMFRSKRLANNTNWRQPQSREEGEEWRSSEPVRSRQLEKWDRDWGDRSSGERSQTWNTNRRTWGGDAQNDENLPEWAVENAECGGTFDSSGAFHGYSNDDTNLPKHQEPTYPLARSHTHGSFPRPKAVEEGSEEWWASEKAKKLSPKRFDASDLKFKKHPVADNSNNSASTASKANTSKGESPEPQVKSEASSATENQNPTTAAAQSEDKYNKVFMNKYPQDNKVLDGMEELSTEDDVGNFQSVLIASNNTLRQKHQHMVMAPDGQGHMLIGIKKSKSEMDHATILLAEDIVDNMFGLSMDDEEIMSNSSTGELSSVGNSMPQNMHNMSKAMPNLSGMTNDLHGHPISGMQPNVMPSGGMQSVGMQVPSGGLQTPNMPSSAVLTAGMAPVGLQNTGLPQTGMPSAGLQAPRVQTPGMQPVMQPVGITNSALNASLGLSIGPGPNIPLALQVPQQVIPSVSMASNMGVMQNPNMAAFQGGNNLPMGNNIGSTNSLFLGQNSTNPSISSSNDMPNHTGQNSMFPLHSLQHSGSQASFGNSIYSSSTQNLAEQWYYEDPERNIQGPFSSKDMYNWYRAGFFSPGLMVRRACEPLMRPLGSYGPVVPFVQMDMPGFPMTGAFESRPQGPRENMLNTQPTLGLDVRNIGNMNMSDNTPLDNLQFGSVGLMANQTFRQPPPMVDSLWGQPSTSAEPMWVQRPLTRTDVNNLPMYFWDQQPSAIASNSLLPEDITKEMKTEDQILAQLRATQNLPQPGLQFISEPQPPTPPAAAKPDDAYPPIQNATPNLEELHKLIQKDTLAGTTTNVSESESDGQAKVEKATLLNQSSSESSVTKSSTSKTSVDTKPSKASKDSEKTAKNKENNNTKNKNKKVKEEKKDETVEIKSKEDEVIKAEKRSQEPSPSKNKKEDKSVKKELEREKKEWIKEGFTIVKGSDKTISKDNKKKAEEARVAEEAERKRKEEEKVAAEEDKKKKHVETMKKQQEQQQQNQARQASESVVKKAPWSAVATQALQSTNRDGLTLAEIQRLEREKKLEQMKEQQQMMQIIAQQQAAALAREQEMQAGLGWAKKKANNANSSGQSLAEIQAEARKQAAAAAAAAAQALEEAQAAAAAAAAAPTSNHVPWGNTHNGGVSGFWDTQLDQPLPKPAKQDVPKAASEQKSKKKPTVVIPPKKETSPAVEFDNWCSGILTSWSSKIDVPTFVGFLKDIESPYEVKDYVKCYLGESKDSNDFARHFLERRSKLLRVGMVTPSDDLCSPALAINPRTVSGSDYQEVKGKGKKTKKNKMLKVDARILGFSVTASEDRINVGDIDTV